MNFSSGFTAEKLLLSRSRKLPMQVATFIGTEPREIASERYGCMVGAIL
jgi:lambda repressor-like predicted transcriptional regulator